MTAQKYGVYRSPSTSAVLGVCLRASGTSAKGYLRYHRVAVLKKNGQRYETAFFTCSGCSVMFLNDSTFNALHAVVAEVKATAAVVPMRGRR